jgi:signal transduction histidine kinase
MRLLRLAPNHQPIVRGFDAPIEFVDGECRGSNFPCVSQCIKTATEAERACNVMADHIAQLIPREDRAEMLRDRYGLRIHHAIQPALAYVLAELVDNVFSHAASVQFPNPFGYLSVQNYDAGDLVRIAVVDDGCGLLATLRGSVEHPPRSHQEAIHRAFEPRTTSKGIRTLYAERRHMGMGLAVCREISRRLGGYIHSVTGNAWVARPGMEDQANRVADPFFQGTIVAVELHRRGATSGVLADTLRSLTESPELRVRFE